MSSFRRPVVGGREPVIARSSEPALDDIQYQRLVDLCLTQAKYYAAGQQPVITDLQLPSVQTTANNGPLAPKANAVILSHIEPDRPHYPERTLWLNTLTSSSGYRLFHVCLCLATDTHVWMPLRDTYSVYFPQSFLQQYLSLSNALLQAGRVRTAPDRSVTEVSTTLRVEHDGQTVFELPADPPREFAVRLNINGAEYAQGKDFIRSGSILNWLGPFRLDPGDTVTCTYLTRSRHDDHSDSI